LFQRGARVASAADPSRQERVDLLLDPTAGGTAHLHSVRQSCRVAGAVVQALHRESAAQALRLRWGTGSRHRALEGDQTGQLSLASPQRSRASALKEAPAVGETQADEGDNGIGGRRQYAGLKAIGKGSTDQAIQAKAELDDRFYLDVFIFGGDD